jgi:hypothetical protein
MRDATRHGEPATEWSWEGNDDQDNLAGRGWAVLDDDRLKRMIFFQRGDESKFGAEREVIEGD